MGITKCKCAAAVVLLIGTLALGSEVAVPQECGAAPAEPKSAWLTNLEKCFVRHKDLPDQMAPGKITALYFSAEWCGPCVHFTPILLDFRARHADQFQFVLVSLDQDDEAMLRYWKKADLHCPVIRKQDIPSLQPHVLKNNSDHLNGIPYLPVFAPDGTMLSHQGRGLLQVPNNDGEYCPVLPAALKLASAVTWKQMLANQQQVVAGRQQKSAAADAKKNQDMIDAVQQEYGEKPLWPVVGKHLHLRRDRYILWRDDTRAAVAALAAYGAQIGKEFDRRADELDGLRELFEKELYFEGQQGPHPLYYHTPHAYLMAGRHASDPASVRAHFLARIATSEKAPSAAGAAHNFRWWAAGLTGAAMAGDEQARTWLADRKEAWYVINALGLGAAQEDAFCLDLLAKIGPRVKEDTQFVYGIALARGAVQGNAVAVDALIAQMERWPQSDRLAELEQAAAGNRAAQAYVAKRKDS